MDPLFTLLQPLSPGIRAVREENRALRDRTARQEDLLGRYELLLGQVRDYAILMLDTEGLVLTWNLGAERLTGYRAEEVVGRAFTLLFPEEDRQSGRPYRELEMARSYGTYQEDGWRQRRDGGRFMANAVVTALHGPDGALAGYAKILRDITMQRDAEARLTAFARELQDAVTLTSQQLQASQARLLGFINHASAAIAFKGMDGRYLLLNPRMETLLGKPREEILGRDDLEVMPGHMGPDVTRDDRKILASGQALAVEEHWVHPDGSGHDYLVQKFPLVDESGQNWGLGVISTDITERKQAEQVRLQSQKLESLGVLAGGIAHDFNNLLGAILGNLGLAQMEISPSSPGHKRLETIESLVVKATNLTRQMLAYSGRGSFEIKPVNLNLLVEEMTRLLSISISKKVVMRYDLARSLPTIQADASQLQQVVMNLVINASDAIGERSGTITLRTSVMSADQEYLERTFQGQAMEPGTFVALEVTDDGTGMSPETQARIFEPFFTTKFSGRGLGLSAIQGIIKGHGGGIRVYSELGRGTTFKLLFPAAGLPAEARAQEPAAHAYQGSGTVLVVDDEDSIRAMASGILGQMGFDALLAADGMEALMLYETHKEDIRLIIMDLTMPHMDGAETFAALRARGYRTPVVLSSGFNESEAVDRFKGVGLAGFLQKPYRVAAFVDAVKAALEGPGLSSSG